MLGGKDVILAYHSLSETEPSKHSDSGYVSPRQRTSLRLFEEQLQWLSQFADFVSLSDIMTPTSSNRWRVAVTFDDGYRDNIELGLPLFRRYEVPVTWFLSTRFIEERNYLPWWDLVDYMIQHVHGVVEVTLRSESPLYDLGVQEGKNQFLRDMREIFMTADQSSREALHKNLRAKCTRFAKVPQNAFADQEFIIQAASSPWISIGGHTVSHPNLAKVSPETAKHEVARGRELLQKWIGESVNWFAYPYGGEGEYNKKIKRILRESGFGGAVTTNRGYISESIDEFEMPRFMVPSWAGMVGFKAGILALNNVDWLVKKYNQSSRWLSRLLRFFNLS